jgi:hypothetical protein
MPVRLIICKARRAGLSTGAESLIYDDTTTNPNTFSLIVANERNPSENVLGMCRRFWKNTPEKIVGEGLELKLRPDLPPQYRNNPPKDRIEFDYPLDSHIFVATARSIDAYLGYGFQNIHATEASRYKNGHELFRALYPTLSPDPHSALYVESTPNGQEGEGAWFYEQVMDAAKRKTTEFGEMRLVFIEWHRMTRSFAIPFDSDEKRWAFGRTLSKTEVDLQRRFPHISLEQLQWRRMILAGPTFNRDEDMFLQEYPEDLTSAFLLSGSSVFRRKDIRRLTENSRPPIWEGDVYWGSVKDNDSRPIHETVRVPHFLAKWEAKDKGFASHVNEGTFENLRVWRWPKVGERLFIACDVGGGDPETRDGDFSTMGVGVMNELGVDELIMTWRGHLIPIAFAEVAAALAWGLRKMVGDDVASPELIPEWTGPGIAMCTYIDTKNLYPNLYRYQMPGVHQMPKTKHIGWESNFKTTQYAMGSLKAHVERQLLDIPDEEVIREMASYRQVAWSTEDIQYTGAAGRHDDYVAMLRILSAVMRLRSATIPGDSAPQEVEDYDGTDIAPFDPFAQHEPGFALEDVDEEGVEETLWYGTGW